MPRIKRFFAIACLFCLFLCADFCRATVWGQTSEPAIRVGVLTRADLEEVTSQQAILLDRLRKEMVPRRVILQYYTAAELSQAVQIQSVDFIICDALFFSAIQKQIPLRPLVGLVYPQALDADFMTASTVFIRKEAGSSAHNLASLRGKPVFVLDKDSFGGFVALQAEVQRSGFNANQFFGTIHETHGAFDVIVEAVLKAPPGEMAGVLPACSLEHMAKQNLVDLSQFEIVNNRRNELLHCVHSTSEYPGWVLAAMPKIEMDVVRKVASVALISSSGDSLQWSLPPDHFDAVQNVLLDLRIGPYAQLGESIWRDVFWRYRWWMLGALLLLLVVLLHGLLVSMQVRARTRDLRDAMQQQQRMNAEILETRSRLQSMEKMQTISHMSSVFAHELKQPLAAIRNFSLGLQSRNEKGTLDKETLRDILNKVIFLTDRASGVVTHVRKYARAEKIERSRQNLTGIVLLAIRTFEKSEQYNVKIYLHDSGAPVFADVNSWEIEFVILNLFKNSGEALKASGRNRIDVTVTQDEYYAVVRVSDNGIGLDDEAMKKIFQPLFSTKVNGMGMGLSIALRIVESHGGRMNAFRNKNHGLTIEIVLTLSKDAENECYE